MTCEKVALRELCALVLKVQQVVPARPAASIASLDGNMVFTVDLANIAKHGAYPHKEAQGSVKTETQEAPKGYAHTAWTFGKRVFNAYA